MGELQQFFEDTGKGISTAADGIAKVKKYASKLPKKNQELSQGLKQISTG